MLDIVISTLNEEGYVGSLLKSLGKQTYKDFQVYLSDGNSSDKTIEVAKQFEKKLPLCIIVDKKRGLAHQRNVGGKAGNASQILFLDADVILPPHFLATLMKQVQGKDLINCWIAPLSKKQIDKILYRLYNLLVLEVVKNIWPVGMGGCLYTKREIFEKMHGFREGLAFWEDIDFIKRAVDQGAKFAILRSPKVYLSTRRFEVEGRINYIMQMLKGTLYAIRTGEIPSEKHISYAMDLDYAKLLKRKKYSEKKLTSLLKNYTIYLQVLKKIHSVTVDSPLSQSILNQLLALPLIKSQRTKIQEILHISNDKQEEQE